MSEAPPAAPPAAVEPPAQTDTLSAAPPPAPAIATDAPVAGLDSVNAEAKADADEVKVNGQE